MTGKREQQAANIRSHIGGSFPLGFSFNLFETEPKHPYLFKITFLPKVPPGVSKNPVLMVAL
jgi:hypothetical protein